MIWKELRYSFICFCLKNFFFMYSMNLFRLGWIQNVQNQAIKVNFLPKKCISCNVFVILSDISITLKVRFSFGLEFEVWSLTLLIFTSFESLVWHCILRFGFRLTHVLNHDWWETCNMWNGWEVGSRLERLRLEMTHGWDLRRQNLICNQGIILTAVEI